jgi:hypothetical protein
MPRYFFHLDDGELSRDQDGSECADLDSARAEAVKLSGALLKDTGGDFWKSRDWHLHVTDAEHYLLFSFHFSAEQPSRAVVFRPV